MKIAYLLGSLNRGGAETLMLDVVRNLKGSDIKAICVHRNKGELYIDFCRADVVLKQLRPRFKLDLLYYIKLRSLLIKENISIIHAQHPLDAFYALISTWS